MSDPQFQLQNNGQQLVIDDVNLLGETAGLAGERLLGELLRVTPFNETDTVKGILPFGYHDGPNMALIAPNGASGSVKINPFTSIVGSRTSYHVDTLENWRDIRAAVSVGVTNIHNEVSFGPASGNPRWDLIVAVVAVDANGPSVTRKVKNPTTKVIAGTTVTTYLQTTVTLTTVAGTPSATPVFPAVPADAGSTYYVPLAYVWIPTAYNGTYQFGTNSVVTVANCITLGTPMGGSVVEVADGNYKAGGVVVSATRQQAWLTSPQKAYLPPTQVGASKLRIALDLSSATVGLHSHANGGVIDSRNWIGRYGWWKAIEYEDGMSFPWEDGLSSTASTICFDGQALNINSTSFMRMFVGQGQTIIRNYNGIIANTSRVVAIPQTVSPGAGGIAIYCDHADGGKLKLEKTSLPRARYFIELDLSPPIGPITHV